MTKLKKKNMGKWLRSLGFDRSYYNRLTGNWFVSCSQCMAQVINRVPCHETGCPNQVKEKED
jgi:hypothetical protein